MYTPDKAVTNTANGAKTIHRMRTINDFAESLQWAQKNNRMASAVSGSSRFTGTDSAAEYEDMMRNGYAHGVKGVEGLEGLSTDASDKIQFERSVGGAFPIVPAFLHGAPDAMLMPVAKPAEAVRGLTLVIDGAFHAGIKSWEVAEYAKSVMRLLAWLAAEGVETAVYSVIAMRHNGDRVIWTTPIREAGGVMQPERIAAICHPSFLRRAWFSLVEREHIEFKLPLSNMCNDCYGYPSEATVAELQQVLPEAYSVILLPKPGSGDPDKAVREAYTLKLKQGA